jgi:putative chitobiose transport system permease protein
MHREPRNPKSMTRREMLLRYVALFFLVLLTIGPFLWLLSTALKGAEENIYAYPPQLLPASPTLANFAKVLESQPLWQYMLNSAIVAALAVISNVLFSSLAAYPLARMPFRGRKTIFAILLASMMIPFQLSMIPLYELAIALGVQNTRIGLLLPHACTAFGIFFMRQAFLSIPKSFEDAAIMEGISRVKIWRYVMMPLLKPALATLAIFTFIAVWGDFLWPLVVLDDPSLFTLPLGVNRLVGTFSMDWRLVAAGAIFSIIPILIVFIAAQRYFIAGAMQGAVKG